MATQIIEHEAINQDLRPKPLLTVEEALEQNTHHIALTADDSTRAAFVASLLGLGGIEISECTTDSTLIPDASEGYPRCEKPFRPLEEALERNAPFYAALTEEDAGRVEFGAALNRFQILFHTASRHATPQ